MPTSSFLSRIGVMDFFAVLFPGSYVVLVGYWVVNIGFSSANHSQTIWSSLEILAQRLQQSPVLLLFLLFASYLAGSIIRTIPVNVAQRIAPPFRERFPFVDDFRHQVKYLSKNSQATFHNADRLPRLEEDAEVVPITVYRYWKNVLCVHRPHSFAHFQSLEARSRFFAGMIWAGATGIAGSLLMLIVLVCRSRPVAPASWLFALSLVVAFFYWLYLGRARRQEQRMLVGLFLAHYQPDQSS